MSDVFNVFVRYMQVMRRRNERLFQKHRRELPRGLSVSRMRLLGELSFHGPLRMNELAYEMGVTPRTITTMVDALDREGLVERQPDPRDRRAIMVTLSEAGQSLGFSEFDNLVHQMLEDMLSPLDDEERRQFYRILLKLTEVWESEIEPDEEPNHATNGFEDHARGAGRGGGGGGRGRQRTRSGGQRGPSGGDVAGRRGRPVGRFSRERSADLDDQPDEPESPAASDDRRGARGGRGGTHRRDDDQRQGRNGGGSKPRGRYRRRTDFFD